MEHKTTEYTYRARNAIRERVNSYDSATLDARLSILRWRIRMLETEWSTSSGDELAEKRRHLVGCINIAEYEVEMIEKRIARDNGGGNKKTK